MKASKNKTKQTTPKHYTHCFVKSWTLVTSRVGAEWLMVRIFSETPFRMDWTSGILLKMIFPRCGTSMQQGKKYHSIRNRSLFPCSLPYKEGGFILMLSKEEKKQTHQWGWRAWAELHNGKPEAKKGGGEVGESHRRDVVESFWSGFESWMERKISGSCCHLCGRYWEGQRLGVMDFKDISVCVKNALYLLASSLKAEDGFELFLIIVFGGHLFLCKWRHAEIGPQGCLVVIGKKPDIR